MSKPQDHRQAAKVEAEKRGRWAETLAAWLLRFSGHRILARNYKTPIGEIDIIAKRGRALRFIEIKARATRDTALSAITAKQRQRIQNAAEAFLIHNPALQICDIHFDVGLVTGRLRLTWLRDAWRADGS